MSQEIVGRSYPPTEPYLVCREKVREFALAVYSSDQRNFDPGAAGEAGFSDVVAPPTFPIIIQQRTLEQLLADPTAGIDFTRVVHGDQRFSYSRPIVAGDELVGVMTVTSVKVLAGNAMITSQTEIHDSNGAHVVTATSSLVVRGES